MFIREAEKSDSCAIARFIAYAESEMVHFFTGSDDIEVALPMLEAFVLSSTENRYSINNVLVAEIDGAPVGAIVCFAADSQPGLDNQLLRELNKRGLNLERLTLEGEEGTWYLSTMGIDPEFRGKGIGTALMNAAMARGRERGYDRVSLLVSPGKPRARALYERLGFSAVGPVHMGEIVYERMCKPL